MSVRSLGKGHNTASFSGMSTALGYLLDERATDGARKRPDGALKERACLSLP